VGTFLKGRSFGTFLSPRKEKYKEKLPNKLKFEIHSRKKRSEPMWVRSVFSMVV
jgi:hypothetical protein